MIDRTMTALPELLWSVLKTGGLRTGMWVTNPLWKYEVGEYCQHCHEYREGLTKAQASTVIFGLLLITVPVAVDTR